MNEKEVLDEVLELMLSNVGTSNNLALTKLVKNYAKSNFQDGSQWNFKRHLLAFASALNNEKNKSYIELLHTLNFDEKECKMLLKELRTISSGFSGLNLALKQFSINQYLLFLSSKAFQPNSAELCAFVTIL